MEEVEIDQVDNLLSTDIEEEMDRNKNVLVIDEGAVERTKMLEELSWEKRSKLTNGNYKLMNGSYITLNITREILNTEIHKFDYLLIDDIHHLPKEIQVQLGNYMRDEEIKVVGTTHKEEDILNSFHSKFDSIIKLESKGKTIVTRKDKEVSEEVEISKKELEEHLGHNMSVRVYSVKPGDVVALNCDECGEAVVSWDKKVEYE